MIRRSVTMRVPESLLVRPRVYSTKGTIPQTTSRGGPAGGGGAGATGVPQLVQNFTPAGRGWPHAGQNPGDIAITPRNERDAPAIPEAGLSCRHATAGGSFQPSLIITAFGMCCRTMARTTG